MAPRAVVLLSGGLDSTTALAVARAEGYECHALSFEYGQRHARELESARRVAAALGAAAHLTLRLDLRAIGGSALTADIPVPKARTAEAIGTGIPVTYVPARNTIFLSHALAWAEVMGAQDIFIGVNVLDASGYPDCRPEYIAAFERLANLATQAGVEGRSHFRIHTPLIALSKADIIRRGRDLGVDYSLTWSCYAPEADGRACGLCDACLLRSKGLHRSQPPRPCRRRIRAHLLRWRPRQPAQRTERYASPAAFGRRLAAGPFSAACTVLGRLHASLPPDARGRLRRATGLVGAGERAGLGAGVVGAGADEAVVRVLLERVRAPAGDAAHREDRRAEIGRDPERVVDDRREEVDVDGQAGPRPHAVVEALRHLEEPPAPRRLGHGLGHAAQHAGARVVHLVDAVAEAGDAGARVGALAPGQRPARAQARLDERLRAGRDRRSRAASRGRPRWRRRGAGP